MIKKIVVIDINPEEEKFYMETPDPETTDRYISQIAGELSDLALAQGRTMLAYILSMAKHEADSSLTEF